MTPEETLISCYYYPMTKQFGWTPDQIDGMEMDMFLEYLVESAGRIENKKHRYIDEIMGL